MSLLTAKIENCFNIFRVIGCQRAIFNLIIKLEVISLFSDVQAATELVVRVGQNWEIFFNDDKLWHLADNNMTITG